MGVISDTDFLQVVKRQANCRKRGLVNGEGERAERDRDADTGNTAAEK